MTYELITPLLLVLCIVLLVILLIRQTSLDHKQERDKLTQEHGLVNLGNKLLDELEKRFCRETPKAKKPRAKKSKARKSKK